MLWVLFGETQLILAQEDTIRRDIGEVVVTATRASVNRSNVPMTVSVVHREEIALSSESALLPVLTGHIPGMFVTQRGVTGFGVANGGTGGISLRGVGGSPTTELLVLIDGHPQYMGIMGHHLPDAYVASDVEKVEVIRGPASILYGSNAMGGVINIITRKQETAGWSANGRMMYGTYNTQKYMVNGGLSKGDFNGYVSVNHDRTDGHRPNSAFAITNGYAKLGYRLNNHFRIWGDASLAAFESQNPGTVAQPMFDNVADIMRGVVSMTAENNHEKVNGALKFFYNFGDHRIQDGYAQGGTPSKYFFHSNDHNYGVTFYQSVRPFTGSLITAGIDYKQYGGHAWNDFTDASPNVDILKKTSFHEVSVYAIMQQALAEKITVSAGVRLDNSEKFNSEWAPQAGLSYIPFRHTVLKASVSKGFRYPTIREMYMFPPQNPDLQPERMFNYELSVGQTFLDSRLSTELTGYLADGSNLIMTRMENGSPKNLNTGHFNNRGIELSARWHLTKSLNIKGNYSYLNMKKTVLSAPGQQAYIAANYQWNQWSLHVNYQYVHKLYLKLEDAASPAVHTTYGLLNAKISWRPSKWLDVFLKGENLAGKSYEVVHGYPMPGITIFGGISISSISKR